MPEIEAAKERIAFISRLLQWVIGCLFLVAGGTVSLLVGRPETLDARTFSVLFYGGCGLSAVFVIIAASLIVWALRNINHLETL